MPRKDRAKQFAPFDALKGLQEALKIKEYEHLEIYEGYKYLDYLYNVLYRLSELNVSASSLYTTLLVRTKVIVEQEVKDTYGEDTYTMLKALKKKAVCDIIPSI